jgi:hypothetical protein
MTKRRFTPAALKCNTALLFRGCSNDCLRSLSLQVVPSVEKGNISVAAAGEISRNVFSFLKIT